MSFPAKSVGANRGAINSFSALLALWGVFIVCGTTVLFAALGSFLRCRLWAWASYLTPFDGEWPLVANLDVHGLRQPDAVAPRAITPQDTLFHVLGESEAMPNILEVIMLDIVKEDVEETSRIQLPGRKLHFTNLPDGEPVSAAKEESGVQVLPGSTWTIALDSSRLAKPHRLFSKLTISFPYIGSTHDRSVYGLCLLIV